jgi:hypothetical protein
MKDVIKSNGAFLDQTNVEFSRSVWEGFLALGVVQWR